MIYLDTSVMLLVLLDQEGAEHAERTLWELRAERVVASSLLAIESARAIRREALDMALVDDLLAGVDLVGMSQEVVDRACSLTGELKSLDAIHLATALILHCESDPVTLLTHDARLAAVARSHGLRVVDPTDESDTGG